MTEFSKRLRSEIEYIGFNRKEFAAKTGIKKRALDAYLGPQQSMPPADIAVKIASVLGLSVEYLITGKEVRRSEVRRSRDISMYIQFRELLDNLSILPDEILNPIKEMIKTAADYERRKQSKQVI